MMCTNLRLLPAFGQAWNLIPMNLPRSSYVTALVHPFSTSSCRPSEDSQSDASPSEDSVPERTNSSPGNLAAPSLSHLNKLGNAHMVNISSKKVTKRTASATCNVHFSSTMAATLIEENRNKKGDVLAVARIAGIMAAKRTAEMIPLCHPIAISHVNVSLYLKHFIPAAAQSTNAQAEDSQAEAVQDSETWAGTGQGDAYKWPSSNTSTVQENKSPNLPEMNRVDWVAVVARVTCEGKTGVEMEALTAASVAALTIYDMCKSVDKGMRINNLRVIKKSGGESGTWPESASRAE